MIKKDRQATIAKQYLDERSYVCLDGKEVLYGEDWKTRKFDLWQRCNGRCEYYIRCNAEAADPHHIIPRSKGRDDRLSNLQALCRYHHNLMDRRQVRWTPKEKLKTSGF